MLILFPLNHLGLNGLGSPPFPWGMLPLPATRQVISGVTRDTDGAILGGCTVELFSTGDDVRQQTVISDPTTGAYSFVVGGGAYYCVAYLAGAPDRAGTTVNTLAGVAV